MAALEKTKRERIAALPLNHELELELTTIAEMTWRRGLEHIFCTYPYSFFFCVPYLVTLYAKVVTRTSSSPQNDELTN